MTAKIWALVAAGTVAAGAASAAPVTIDNFNTTSFQVVGAPTDPGGINPATDVLATADAIGGTRTITNERTSINPSITAQQVVTVVSGGNAAVSLPAGVTGTSTFSWFAGGADLTDGGSNDRIDISVISADQAGVIYTLNLDGQSQSLTATTGGMLSFSFAGFGSEDGSDIDNISLLIEGPTAFDTTFDFIGAVPSAVPLPAAGLMLLAGLGVAGALRSRRR